MTTPEPSSLTSPHTEHAESHPLIPENAPTVAFDTSLGNKYEYVDFDYGQYASLAKDIGLSEEATRSLMITLQPKAPGGAAGEYDPNEHAIVIQTRRGVNNTLTHESKHAADFTNGEIIDHRRYTIGAMASRASRITLPLSALATGVSIGILASHNNPGFLPLGIVTGAAIVEGVHHYGYTTHPVERRAEKAAKQYSRNVVTLQKK